MGETWDSAEPEDQRDLVRLMFREIRIDFTTGRVVALILQAVKLADALGHGDDRQNRRVA